jgi:hypothetical protein
VMEKTVNNRECGKVRKHPNEIWLIHITFAIIVALMI